MEVLVEILTVHYTTLETIIFPLRVIAALLMHFSKYRLANAFYDADKLNLINYAECFEVAVSEVVWFFIGKKDEILKAIHMKNIQR